MPWYEYSVTPDGTRQPLVVARILHGNKQVQLIAVVDSGADVSLINLEYADVLGLDIKDAVEDEAQVASGESVKVYSWPEAGLEIQFETHRFPFLGNFVEFSPDSDGQNLMGRGDFFSQFIIQFWDAKSLMNIDLSPDHPNGDATTQV